MAYYYRTTWIGEKWDAIVILTIYTRSRFYESAQQRLDNIPTVTWLARNFETVKFPITSSPRARPSNWVNSALV